jgi:hypothetical protein
MSAETCNVQVFRASGYFQQLENTHTLPDLLGTDPARVASAINLFETFMPETGDH